MILKYSLKYLSITISSNDSELVRIISYHFRYLTNIITYIHSLILLQSVGQWYILAIFPEIFLISKNSNRKLL